MVQMVSKIAKATQTRLYLTALLPVSSVTFILLKATVIFLFFSPLIAYAQQAIVPEAMKMRARVGW